MDILEVRMDYCTNELKEEIYEDTGYEELKK